MTPSRSALSTVTYGLALGSNLGDRLFNLQRGLGELLARVPGGMLLAAAPVYETEPVGCPPGSQSFYNTVIELASPLAPHAMHRVLQAVESLMGRPDERELNAPRPLDIDILYADDLRLDDDLLTVPHPRLHFRRFVLQPLADIRPDLLLPGQEHSVRQLLAMLPEASDSVKQVRVDWA
jgi:2-amino-4-hydroxy-6-hydroxymethyldihydropteridine diphosphokinase